MPIYRYQCAACGESFEVWAKISDAPPTACAKCGSGPITKALARTAFHLKGGGWYAQGYGATGGGASGSSSGSGGGGGSDSAGTKTDTAEKAPEKAPAKPAASSDD